METRPILVATRAACVFIGVIVVLLNAVRGPLVSKDYLIVGVVGTLAAMAVIFMSLRPPISPLRRVPRRQSGSDPRP
jgi:hypothetical protein